MPQVVVHLISMVKTSSLVMLLCFSSIAASSVSFAQPSGTGREHSKRSESSSSADTCTRSCSHSLILPRLPRHSSSSAAACCTAVGRAVGRMVLSHGASVVLSHGEKLIAIVALPRCASSTQASTAALPAVSLAHGRPLAAGLWQLCRPPKHA
jgi:hypothetical protein